MSLRDNLRRDAVSALRTLEPIAMGVEGTVRDAIRLMQDHRVGCVFVTEHNRPIGVFTERDVLTRVMAGALPLDTSILEVMTQNPQVITEGNSVASVIQTMYDGGFRHMPVVDDSGHLTHVVSVKRIVEYLVEHFPSTVFNLPPKPVQSLTSREGA
ncbi:MAG: CBS domain-containing protein [Planctomycetes bacterium]|nr:CBS domain-containing protein [Planctomycetota bacterium]